MIGRAAQGKPWLFREVQHFLDTGNKLDPIGEEEKCQLILEHLNQLYALYGQHKGIRFARKHVVWYLNKDEQRQFLAKFNRLETTTEQCSHIEHFFEDSYKINKEQNSHV